MIPTRTANACALSSTDTKTANKQTKKKELFTDIRLNSLVGKLNMTQINPIKCEMNLFSHLKLLDLLREVCQIHYPQAVLPPPCCLTVSPSNTLFCPLVSLSINTQPPDGLSNSKVVGHLLCPAKLDKVIDLLLVSRAQLAWLMMPSVWSWITTEVQSSFTQSAHHTLSLSLCLSASTFEDGVYHCRPTHTNTHTWCDISPLGISSSSRPSAPHLLLLNPVYLLHCNQRTHI